MRGRNLILLGALSCAASWGAPARAADATLPPSASVSATDTVAPKARSEFKVTYPEGASGDATVVLTLTIERDGTVSAAIPSETNEPFSTAAAATASAWQFEPALHAGGPVRARIRVEVTFHAPIAAAAPPDEAPTTTSAPTAPARVDQSKPKPKPIEIQVLGVKPEPSRTVTLSRAEVRQIPGTFGDPFRALEIMPGVTPIVSGLPFFFVRGAPPGDVGYFLDGIRVPLLFHVGVGHR